MPRSVETLLLALAVLFPVAVTVIVVSRLLGSASAPADQVGVEGAATRVATATRPVLGSTTRATPTVRPTSPSAEPSAAATRIPTASPTFTLEPSPTAVPIPRAATPPPPSPATPLPTQPTGAPAPTAAPAAPTPAPPPAPTPAPAVTVPVATATRPPAPAAQPGEAQALNGIAFRPENGAPVLAYPLGVAGGRAVPFQFPLFGAERWQGAADASGQFTAAWDAEFLYLSAAIGDDRFQPWAGDARLLYLGDGLELQLDPDLAGSFHGPQWGGGAVHLGLRPAASGEGPGDAYIWTPVTRPAPEIRVATTRGQGAGYTLAASIPWQLLGVSPHPRLALGFCLDLDDADAPGARTQQDTLVSACPRRAWHVRSSLGTLVLVDRPR